MQSLGAPFGFSFSKLQDFANFVKDPNTTSLAGILGLSPEGTGTLGGSAEEVEVAGVELDMNKLQQIARIGPRRTYRVVGSASVGKLNKKITAVWDTNVQAQNARNAQSAALRKGAWVYWRED